MSTVLRTVWLLMQVALELEDVKPDLSCLKVNLAL